MELQHLQQEQTHPPLSDLNVHSEEEGVGYRVSSIEDSDTLLMEQCPVEEATIDLTVQTQEVEQSEDLAAHTSTGSESASKALLIGMSGMVILCFLMIGLLDAAKSLFGEEWWAGKEHGLCWRSSAALRRGSFARR